MSEAHLADEKRGGVIAGLIIVASAALMYSALALVPLALIRSVATSGAEAPQSATQSHLEASGVIRADDVARLSGHVSARNDLPDGGRGGSVFVKYRSENRRR